MNKDFLTSGIRTLAIAAAVFVMTGTCISACGTEKPQAKPQIQKENIVMHKYSSWYYVSEANRGVDPHNINRYENYHASLNSDAPYNDKVLKATDKVMLTAPDGGTYYTGKGESPVGYHLEFNNYLLLCPPRPSSYCSGSTYAAFIEAMNLINRDYALDMTEDQLDALRTQEQDGKPRPDNVKMWGYWNNDFWGIYDSMLQYSSVGEVIPPYNALPGDFMKIMWTKTSGHFVVFLGWVKGADNVPVAIRYWSSQTGTNGFGEQESSLSKVYSLLPVRLKHPDNIKNIDPNKIISPLGVDDAGYVLN